MDRESVSLSCVTRPAYFRRTTGWTIVGIVEMDGIFLGIETGTSKGNGTVNVYGDKRGGEGEREGRICLRGLYVSVSPSVSPLVGLSIGRSVGWLVDWSVMLLLRTRESSFMRK